MSATMSLVAFFLDDLKKRGVDVSSSVIRKGADTYFTTNCIAPDGEKRMILCFGDAIYLLSCIEHTNLMQ